MSDALTQEQANHLIAIEKIMKERATIRWPSLGGKIAVGLTSHDRAEEFVVNATRSYIKIGHLSLNARVKSVITLVRLEIDGSPHRNPDDIEMECPHIHLYREGYGTKWAFPLPDGVFTDLTNQVLTFQQFMAYFNVTDLPEVTAGLL